MTFDPNKHLSAARKGGPANYLAVQWRLVWLRDDHPEATIITEPIRVDEQFAFFRATVSYPYTTATVDGELVTVYATATGHGSETLQDFRDYIEKAETKALGRALAAIGYGTQFAAVDFDEGDTVADAPVQRQPQQQQRQAPQPQQQQRQAPQPQPAPPAPTVPLQAQLDADIARITARLKATLTGGEFNLLRREIVNLGLSQHETISILVTEVEQRMAEARAARQQRQPSLA